jgi:MATE family multidrug resistance protein
VNPCSLGPVPLATQSVLITTVATTFQAPYSLGIATSIRIGNLLGEKKAIRASVAANAAMLVSICLALFSRFACSFVDFPQVYV